MIRFVRTSNIAPGRFADALAFAKEISDYIQKNSGTRVEVMLPVGGNPQRVAWRAEYENLGAMETSQMKMLADPKYLELAAKGATNFIAGSTNDVIWRTV
jgi:ketopantoate hydroxymethyltransferase